MCVSGVLVCVLQKNNVALQYSRLLFLFLNINSLGPVKLISKFCYIRVAETLIQRNIEPWDRKNI